MAIATVEGRYRIQVPVGTHEVNFTTMSDEKVEYLGVPTRGAKSMGTKQVTVRVNETSVVDVAP
jgi:hypothetical protein